MPGASTDAEQTASPYHAKRAFGGDAGARGPDEGGVFRVGTRGEAVQSADGHSSSRPLAAGRRGLVVVDTTSCCERYRTRGGNPRGFRWIRPRWPAASRGDHHILNRPVIGTRAAMVTGGQVILAGGRPAGQSPRPTLGGWARAGLSVVNKELANRCTTSRRTDAAHPVSYKPSTRRRPRVANSTDGDRQTRRLCVGPQVRMYWRSSKVDQAGRTYR